MFYLGVIEPMDSIKNILKQTYNDMHYDKTGITKLVCDAAVEKAYLNYKDESTIIELCEYITALYYQDNGLDKAFLGGVLRTMQKIFPNLKLCII